jgi:hypothetical protein
MSDDKSAVDEQKIIGEDVAPKTKEETEKDQAVQDYSTVEEDGKLSMHVKVYSPFKDYYDGKAFSLSAINATGPFDILPRHHNFISLLSPCELVLRTTNNGEQKIQISGGIMHVKADKVIVFLDI